MEIRELRLEEINPAEYNPRLRMLPKSFEYQALDKSLEEFGLVIPLVVNVRTMTLVAGHQRFWILQDQGKETADCVIVDYDKEQEKALNLALNKIDGEYDYGKLADILEELKKTDIDMDITGFREEQINDILNEIDSELYDSDLEIDRTPKKADTKEGVKCLVG